MSKKERGIQFGGNSLPGAQTIGRKMAQQFNLRGGLANAVDISAQKPNEWIYCTNAKTPSITKTAFGGIINSYFGPFTAAQPNTLFGNNNTNSYSDSNFAFNTQPNEVCVASLEIGVTFPSESVVYTGTGTGSTINSISVGDKCEQLALTASQTITGTYTVPAKTLTNTYIISPNTIIGLDTNWSGSANFASGFIRIGSDSSNYYQWSVVAPASDGNKVLKFNWAAPGSTVGTPVLTNITYVVINLVATAGGSMTVQVSNLRIGAFTSTSLSSSAYTSFASNISCVFPYVSNSITPSNYLIMQCKNVLYIQTSSSHLASNDSQESFIPLKTGFNNLINSIASQYAFNFATFPKTGSANKNILYYTNGNDGIFSYDANASAGSRHSQISATAFKGLVAHKNYMWYWGDPANPNTITPSVLSTPGTLDTANAITLNNQDGQNFITGVVSMDDYLIIFRSKDIWIMLGTTTGAGGDIVIRKSNSINGALFQKGITRVGPLVYFWDGHGVYSFDGSNSTLISEKINFNLTNASVALIYNQTEDALYVAFAPVDPNNTLGNPIPSGDYSDCGCFIYNLILKNWTLIGQVADTTSVYFGGFTFCSPNSYLTYFYLYGLAIYTPIQNNNLVNAFDQTFDVQSSWNNLGSPFVQKDPDKVRLFISTTGSSKTGTLNFRTDFETAIAYTTTFTLPVTGTGSGFVDLTVGPGCQGHAFSVEVVVTNNSSTQSSGNIIYSGYGLSWTEAEVI